MKTISNPIFLFLAALFLLHQVAQKWWGWEVLWADHYLDTFLMAPLLLTGLLAEWRDLYQLGEQYVFSSLVVLVATLVLLFISELLFPYFSEAFTADPLDVLAITAGSVFFSIFLNRPLLPGTPP